QVGAGSFPKLRGTGSISLSNTPIIYVDGIRIDRREVTGPGGGSGPSRFDDIRPEDIENIEIIKGPAASTLYGTEASNGVIQIITKQGRPGQRAQITVSTEHGVNWFKNPQGEFPPNYYRAPDGTVLIQDLYDEEKAAGRDVFRDGYHQSYNVGIRGGATGLGYYLSADYEDKDGVLPNNGLKRFSARGNVNAQVRDNLDITSSMGFITADWTRAPEGGSVNLGQLTGLLWGSPRDKNTPLRGFLRAPPEESAKIQIGQEAEHFTWSVKGEHRLFGWLTHRLTVGTDIVSERNFRLWPRQVEGTRHFFAARGLGEKFVQNVIRQNNTLDYAATANFSLRPDLTSTTSFGVQYYARKENLTQALGEIFPAPGLETVSAGSRRSGDESFLENKTFGLFIQQQFGWKNRVFLTAALRADDNSAFGKEVDPAYYPKVSGVWVLSEEPFWNVGSWLNEFRIRGAWGAAGQQPDAYASVRTFEPVAGPGGTSALNPGKPGNPKLKPEKGEELEVGFDAGLFGGRVGLDFTYYSNSTKDAIVLKDVAPSEGWGGVQFVNIGEIRNWGFEVGLNARLVEMGALSWEVNGKLAHSKDEIVSLGGIPPINTGAGRRQVWHIEGYPVGGFWNKKIVSAQRGADGRMTNILCDGGAANNHQPMSCDEAPDIFIGGPGPYWDAVVTNALNVGKLRITALLDMKLDQRKLNVQRYASDYIFFNSERINVPEKTDPLFLAAVQLNNLGPIVERIDWIRLREIGASYTLPEAWARRFFGATSLVVTASGRNLWDIWDHPESTFVGGEEEIQTDTRSWVRETQTIIAPQALFLTGFRVTF
ncbi:MAG: TonB-dependent receptor, partial [Gemmatimonadetes bacterium]|nr:TonB-dependent receptor [Gemmatimonadota bacterium]